MQREIVGRGVIAGILGASVLALWFLILFGATQAFALAFTTVLAETMEGTIRWWTAVLGNPLAVAAMVAYLWSRHRRTRRVQDDREVFDPRQ